MKNISKQLFFALTVVSLIALVVYIIQYFIINSGEEPDNSGSVIAEGIPAQETPESSSSEPDTASPSVDDLIETPGRRPPYQGQRHELLIDTSGSVLALYADEAKFEYAENEYDWQFIYKSGGSSALEIGFAYLPLQGVGPITEVYLNERTDGNEAEYKGELQIADSTLKGYNVQAIISGITYETWFYRLQNSELSLYFLINYEFNGQKDDLYTVLSSISIEEG